MRLLVSSNALFVSLFTTGRSYVATTSSEPPVPDVGARGGDAKLSVGVDCWFDVLVPCTVLADATSGAANMGKVARPNCSDDTDLVPRSVEIVVEPAARSPDPVEIGADNRACPDSKRAADWSELRPKLDDR